MNKLKSLIKKLLEEWKDEPEGCYLAATERLSTWPVEADITLGDLRRAVEKED